MVQEVVRAVSASLGVLSRAHGSAQFAHGATSAAVGVFGPTEVKGRKELTERAGVEVTLHPVAGQASLHETEMAAWLGSVLSEAIVTALYPRCVIRVVAQVLRDDGSLRAVVLNAASMALMHAGVAMRAVVSGVCVALPQASSLSSPLSSSSSPSKPAGIILDPDGVAEAAASATVCFAFQCSDDTTAESVGVVSCGPVSATLLEAAHDLAIDQASSVRQLMARVAVGEPVDAVIPGSSENVDMTPA